MIKKMLFIVCGLFFKNNYGYPQQGYNRLNVAILAHIINQHNQTRPSNNEAVQVLAALIQSETSEETLDLPKKT